MTSGVHNVREPLDQQVPVLVGPRHGTEAEELKQLSQQNVLRTIANLTDLCIGNEGRDIWLTGWFPWEIHGKIPTAIQVQKHQVEQGFHEFQQWLQSNSSLPESKNS